MNKFKITQLKRQLKEAEEIYKEENRLKKLSAQNILRNLLNINSQCMKNREEMNNIVKKKMESGLEFNPLDYEDKISVIRENRKQIRERKVVFADVMKYKLGQPSHMRQKWVSFILEAAIASILDDKYFKSKLIRGLARGSSVNIEFDYVKLNKNIDVVSIFFKCSEMDLEFKIKSTKLLKIIEQNGAAQ